VLLLPPTALRVRPGFGHVPDPMGEDTLRKIDCFYRTLIGDLGWLASAAFASRALLLLRDMLLARILGPEGYGMWTQILVVLSYSLHLPLGFQHTVGRDVPFSLGSSEIQKVKAIQDTAYLVTLGMSILAVVVAVAVLPSLGIRLFDLPLPTLVALSAALLAQQLYGFYSILLRAHQRFRPFSIGFAGAGFAALGLGVLFSYLWGVNGAILSQALAYFLIVVYWSPRSPFRPLNTTLPRSEIPGLLRRSIPLFLVGLNSLLLASIDRLLVAVLYSGEIVGYYGLAFLLKLSLQLLIAPLMQSIGPRLMKDYGKHQNPKFVSHYLVLMTFVFGFGIAVLVGGLYIAVSDLLTSFLPRYGPSVTIAQVMLVGAALAAVAAGASNFLLSIYKQRQVLALQLTVVAMQFSSIVLVAQSGGSIKGIAQVSAGAAIIYSILALLLAGFSVHRNLWHALIMSAKTLGIIAYVLGSSILVSHWGVAATGGALLRFSIHFAVWMLAMLPAMWIALRVTLRMRREA